MEELENKRFTSCGVGRGRGTARAEDAQKKPTQSHSSLCILVYEDKQPTAATHLDTRVGRRSCRIRMLPGRHTNSTSRVVPKLTRWVRGTTPSTLARKGAKNTGGIHLDMRVGGRGRGRISFFPIRNPTPKNLNQDCQLPQGEKRRESTLTCGWVAAAAAASGCSPAASTRHTISTSQVVLQWFAVQSRQL